MSTATKQSPTPTSTLSLDQFLVSGIAWTALFRWVSQAVSWIAHFYAARRLQPADYGLVSMAMLAIGLARMVEDFGMDSILIQDRSLTGKTQSRLAGFIVLLGLAASLLFVGVAFPLGEFFKEPQVALIVMALSPVLLMESLQVVPRAQLQRTLGFYRLGLVTFIQIAVTSLVLVVSAWRGLGHWSLVLNALSGTAAATILLIFWHPYRISWPREVRTLAKPLLEGWRVLVSRAAYYGYSNADQTIIGRVLGKDALGAYSFAVTFSTVAQQEIGSIVSRVAPGIFSEVQTNRAELRRYFLLLTEFLAVITFPMAIGLALTADLVIPIVLGDGWDSVVRPLQLLCVYSTVVSARTLVAHVLLWTGQFRAYMWTGLLTGVTMPLILLGGVRYGLPGIGWAWVLFCPFVDSPSMFLAFRQVNVTLLQWLDSLKSAGLSCAAMCATVIGVRVLLPDGTPQLVTTAISISAGLITYPAVLWFGFRPRMRTLIELAKKLRT